MARQKKSGMNQYMWYGLYAIVGYYGYQWWKQQQVQVSTTIVSVPPGTGV